MPSEKETPLPPLAVHNSTPPPAGPDPMTADEEDRLTGKERRRSTAEHLAEDLGIPENEAPGASEADRNEATLPVQGR